MGERNRPGSGEMAGDDLVVVGPDQFDDLVA